MSMEENRLTHTMPTWNNTTRNPTSTSSQIPSISSLSLLEPNKACNKSTPPISTNNIIIINDDDKGKGKGKGKEEVMMHSSSSSNNNNNNNEKKNINGEEGAEEVTGRERLKRHREEVKGKVKIPENWEQEKLLKDWIDYTTFDALLAPRHRLIVAARDALVADARKAAPRSQRLRIHI